LRGVALFGRRLRVRPLSAILGLALEYAGYFAACLFVIALLLTRAPLRLLDWAFGLRLRERAINLIARVSPG
jgi:hypothetical protein